MTTVGELFIDLGIQGSDKAISAVQGVGKEMESLGSSALTTKAAILGAVYGIQQLVDFSDKLGTNLVNFQAVTGISSRVVQQYQFAAEQIVGANVNVSKSLAGIQQEFTDAVKFGKAPEGIGLLGQAIGRPLGYKDFQEWIGDPTKFYAVIQEMFDKVPDKGLRNAIAKKVGIGDDLLAVFAQHGFDQNILNQAPVLSDQQTQALHKADTAWLNLGRHIQMTIAQLNASYGPGLVTDLTKLTDQVLKLVTAFSQLSEKMHFFEATGLAIQSMANALKEVAGYTDTLVKFFNGLKGLDTTDATNSILKSILLTPGEQEKTKDQGLSGAIKQSLEGTKAEKLFNDLFNAINPPSPNAPLLPPGNKQSSNEVNPTIEKNQTVNIAPSPTAGATSPAPNVTNSANQYSNSLHQTASINQNFNFNGEETAKDVQMLTQKHINEALFQNPAIAWWS